MKLWPFKVIPDLSDKPMIVISFKDEQKHFTLKEISSMVLIKMKEIVHAYLERLPSATPPSRVVEISIQNVIEGRNPNRPAQSLSFK
ncbi:Heat shock cognate 70 kDa protein 2 [Acorus calamus]|uniref:Heat shock cognate 70 kDa protein 2 n=1 Tax=Acorus calamus TaxID=4465 RepID=A0AAV9DD27_ACOCL|nr:Heat shock cognate 70 kDa protein 2 [Acorus calamus]